MISYRRVEKESDELLYTVWSLVMVRELNLSDRTASRDGYSAINDKRRIASSFERKHRVSIRSGIFHVGKIRFREC